MGLQKLHVIRKIYTVLRCGLNNSLESLRNYHKASVTFPLIITEMLKETQT